MNIESALGILARRAQLEEVKDGLNISIETSVTLPGDADVPATQVSNGLAGVAIQLRLGGDTVASRVFTVVPLVVERGCVPLVVRRDDTAAQYGPVAMFPMVHLADRVSLGQVLSGIA